MSFLHKLPEISEAPAPAALPGESITPSKLTALRRQQLIYLAKAYQIDLQGAETKTQILPFMIAAETRGTFREKPPRPYFFKLAQLNHDMPLAEQDRSAFHRELRKLELAEYRENEAEIFADNSAAKAQLAAKGKTYGELLQRCKELGMNGTGRSTAAILAMIQEKENELAREASESDQA